MPLPSRLVMRVIREVSSELKHVVDKIRRGRALAQFRCKHFHAGDMVCFHCDVVQVKFNATSGQGEAVNKPRVADSLQ